MKNKVVTVAEAVKHVENGMTVMIGGFMSNGTAQSVMDEMVVKQIKDLTVIANDTGLQNDGIGKLIAAHLVKKCYASHIGLNPEAGQQMISGEIDMTLVPQGTLIEKIRAGGAGLGGFLTPTGLGTEVAEGKQVITVEGMDYLLELPLRANVAIIRGSVVDTIGNVVYHGTTQNFNLCMAMAADLVICEAETIVEAGEIDPNAVMTPGLFVDYVVPITTKGGDK